MSTDSFDKDGIYLQRDSQSGVFTICMDRGENRVNPSLVKDMGDALKIVEEADHPKALIITAKGKFFSNGLDLAWAKAPHEHPEAGDRAIFGDEFLKLMRVSRHLHQPWISPPLTDLAFAHYISRTKN